MSTTTSQTTVTKDSATISANATASSGPNKSGQDLNVQFKEWSQVYSFLELNPDSFTTWEDLLEITEGLEGGLCKASSLNAVRLFRFSYDSFLDRFPLVHGYWTKYAQIEFKLGNTDQALSIYEKAISVLPYCVNLWTQYAVFKNLTSFSVPETRRFFEKGAKTVGYHYLSHSFWDEYIKFEKEKGTEQHLLELYKTIIKRPIHQYAKYFNELAKLLPETEASKMVSSTLYDQYKKEYQQAQTDGNKSKSKAVENSSNPESQAENKSNIEDTTSSKENSSAVTSKTSNEENAEECEKFIKEKIAEYYNDAFTQIQNMVQVRWAFESELQTHFFHVVYLPEEELVAWRRYLHYAEMSTEVGMSFEERLSIYERSIVTFGHYEEFWLRYILWLTAHQEYDRLKDVYRRAGYVLPIGRIQVRLQYALFEEAQGNTELAKSVYTSLLEALPTVTEILVGYTCFLHRTESTQNAIKFLETKIGELENDVKSIKNDKDQDDQTKSSDSTMVAETDASETTSTHEANGIDGSKDDINTTKQDSDSIDLPALYVFLAKSYYGWLGSKPQSIAVYKKAVENFPSSYYSWREFLRFIIDQSSGPGLDAWFFEPGSDSTAETAAPQPPPPSPPKKKRGRPSAKVAVASEPKEVMSSAPPQLDLKVDVQQVYQQIKKEAHLKENEQRDLAHIYMVYLLSNTSSNVAKAELDGSTNPVKEYFQVDIEAHLNK